MTRSTRVIQKRRPSGVAIEIRQSVRTDSFEGSVHSAPTTAFAVARRERGLVSFVY